MRVEASSKTPMEKSLVPLQRHWSGIKTNDMKTYTLIHKIYRGAVLTIQAKDWNAVEFVLKDMGINLEDWDY